MPKPKPEELDKIKENEDLGFTDSDTDEDDLDTDDLGEDDGIEDAAHHPV